MAAADVLCRDATVQESREGSGINWRGWELRRGTLNTGLIIKALCTRIPGGGGGGVPGIHLFRDPTC